MTGLLDRSTARPLTPDRAAPEVIPGVRLRPATAQDIVPVGAFLRGLSLDSSYRRFFTGLGSVPDSLVRRLLDTGSGRTVVLATAGAEIVGVADTTVVNAGRAVELGIVVADRWQRRGLGWPLADAALAPARARGIRTLRAHTLPDNARVARMLRRRWPSARPRFEDGTLIWDIDLAGAAARER
jgi:GNAT superfamily N-acetyltransferase